MTFGYLKKHPIKKADPAAWVRGAVCLALAPDQDEAEIRSVAKAWEWPDHVTEHFVEQWKTETKGVKVTYR